MERKMTQMRRFIKQISSGSLRGRLFRSVADFVLKKGQPFQEKAVHVTHGYPYGKMRECFYNSLMGSNMYNMDYCEGYGWFGDCPIPVYHAWNLLDGKVCDLTWRAKDSIYFGVTIPTWYANRIVSAKKTYGVLDAWEIGFPILTGDHKWPPLETEVVENLMKIALNRKHMEVEHG